MSDSISRQDAIDEVVAWLKDRISDKKNGKPLTERLKDLPPAQPGWIPCKTALPEKRKYVLCQCRAGIMDVLHLTDDNGWYKDSTHIYMHGFVLAWMPLPEPYQEKKEVD